jgi:hypothetical protein
MTIEEDKLRYLHRRLAIEPKEKLCRHGPDDLPPSTVVEFDDGCLYLGHLEEPTNSIGMTLAVSVYALWLEHHGTLSSVTTVFEGYARHPGEDFDIESYEPGDAARDFAENPGSNVSEIIVTAVFEWDDGLTCSMLTHYFHYDDGGVLGWGETLFSTGGDTDGAVNQALAQAWKVMLHG